MRGLLLVVGVQRRLNEKERRAVARMAAYIGWRAVSAGGRGHGKDDRRCKGWMMETLAETDLTVM